MVTLEAVRKACARENDLANRRLHFFSSIFSIYFSWIFINLKLSANQVTALFFFVGLTGGALFFSTTESYILLGYLCWRLHIIFDLCDGDVARYTRKFSINGAYWDYMAHSILYPLFFVAASMSAYCRHDTYLFLYVAAFGAIIVSQTLAVKNNYYRAMLSSGVMLDKPNTKNGRTGLQIWANIFIQISSFEGFLFSYVAAVFLGADKTTELAVFLLYTTMFVAISITKFYLFSRDGGYIKRA